MRLRWRPNTDRGWHVEVWACRRNGIMDWVASIPVGWFTFWNRVNA